jgi:AraC family transcriptional regulator
VDLEATAYDHRATLWTAEPARRIPTRSARVCAGLAPWQLARVRRHVERHLDSRLTNADLAALVRLNEDHFARAFKVSVGRPPHAYVLERRVERATSLLLGGHLPLSQIAVAAGFADQAHLSRRFRETVGASPGSWQRQYFSFFERPSIRWSS